MDRFAPRRPVMAPLEAAPALVASAGEVTDGYSGVLEAPKLAGEVAPDVRPQYAVGSTP